MKLFLEPIDIPALTGFSGNIDIDNLKPAIRTAQTTQIKRILGTNLYNKIHNDLEALTPLTGDYLTIFDDYIVYMTAFFSASIYLSISIDKVSNGGVHKMSIENGSNSSDVKVNQLSKNYEAIAMSYESNFKDFMKTISISEYGIDETLNETTNFIPWY